MVTLLDISHLKEEPDKEMQFLHTCRECLSGKNEQIQGICISDHKLEISAYPEDAA